jgi:hypothetical protein
MNYACDEYSLTTCGELGRIIQLKLRQLTMYQYIVTQVAPIGEINFEK